MTLAICNLCAAHVTGVNKTEHSPGRPTPRHAGAKETAKGAFMGLISPRRRRTGKHAKLAGRHARPPRPFF